LEAVQLNIREVSDVRDPQVAERAHIAVFLNYFFNNEQLSSIINEKQAAGERSERNYLKEISELKIDEFKEKHVAGISSLLGQLNFARVEEDIEGLKLAALQSPAKATEISARFGEVGSHSFPRAQPFQF